LSQTLAFTVGVHGQVTLSKMPTPIPTYDVTHKKSKSKTF